MNLFSKNIKPLLQIGAGAMSRSFSYVGLCVGVLLLFCSVQMFVNIRQLLKGNAMRKNGFDYIAVTKKVTNENMGQNEKAVFNETDIHELKSKSFIEDVAPLVSTNFQIELNGPEIIPFKTDLFLEAIRPDFIDTLPANFDWHEGQAFIPIIVSSEFLEVFNVFAPSQGYPAVSPETISGIPVTINCTGNGVTQVFTGKIIAFTDRISSALAPLSFIEWADMKFGGQQATHYSRLYIKTRDANNSEFLNFLDQKNYKVNKDKTRFGRTKQVLEGIFSGLGIFGLLVVILSLMLYSFYLQLVIAKSKENLQLLLTLGYSPKWLSKKISRQQVPVYTTIILIALVLSQLMQLAFRHFILSDQAGLSWLLNWLIFFTALFLLLSSFFINYKLVKNLIYRLDT